MSTSLTATVTAGVSWQYTSTLTGSQTVTDSNSFSFSASLSNGTGAAGTADLLYYLQGTIAASGNTVPDFSGGLTDKWGNTITMARIKYLFLNHTADTTASALTVGNATNPVTLFSATTTTISLRNGGILFLGCSDATGIAVSNGATDQLKLLNADGANTATYRIAVIGSSA